MTYSYDPIRRMSNAEALAYAKSYGTSGGEKQSNGLTMHVRKDDAGREIREYTGDIGSWMNEFKGDAFQMVRINKTGGNAPLGGMTQVRIDPVSGKVGPA